MNNSLSKLGLIALITSYIIIAVIFSQMMHFSRALDEGYHLEYVTFIKQQGRLPITYEERSQITRADFPPLYQLLVSLISTNVEIGEAPKFKLFWDSFRYRAIDHDSDQVWILDTEDFEWPYVGRFLVWQIGRWFSIFLSAATLVIVFLTLGELPPISKTHLPLIGVALLAFIPRYITIGTAFNDDNLLGLLAALYFWMVVKAVRSPLKWWPFVGLGLFLGMSMTVKYTLALMPLEIIILCFILSRKYGLGRGWLGQRLVVTGSLAFLASSWWFGWNIWFLNTVAEDGWLVGLLRPLMAEGHDQTLNRLTGIFSGGQAGLETLPEDIVVGTFAQWVQATFLTFWGVGSVQATPVSPYAYILVGGMLLVAGYGLWRIWSLDRCHATQSPVQLAESGAKPASPQTPKPVLSKVEVPKIQNREWLLLFCFHITLFIVLPLLRFFLTRRLSVAAQGRHLLIPAATAIIALLIWGLATAIPQRWQRLSFALIIALFMAWTGAHLYQIQTTMASPLPLRTLPEAAAWLSEPANVQFGEIAELGSYHLEPQPERGMLHLELAWRALGYATENYLLKVTVVDSTENIVSCWIGHQGQGRLPTLAWEPGDVIFDRLALPLPGVAAGAYQVRLQLLGRTGPLIVNGDDSLLLTQVTLDQATLLSMPQTALFDGVDALQVDFALWQGNGPVVEAGALPVYRYPGTITLIAQPDLQVELIDPAGQVWPATQSENGINNFVIGPRWPSGAYQARLSLLSKGEWRQVTVSPQLMVENWWERKFDIPQIEVPLEANFADQIEFLGYKLPQKQVQAGQSFPVTLYWQAPPDKSPQAEFIQFNQLLDSSGELWGGYDRQPLEYYNTLLWAPAEVVVDGYAVPVDPAAPPGQYYLNVGYYLTVGESAVNLPLVVDGQMSQMSSVTIGPIEVVRP